LGCEVHSIRVIDSHTEGEPTRVVLSGSPDLGDGPLSERLATFKSMFDGFRSAVVNEPRGSDVLVGALLVEPYEPDCIAGVIFFNNVGYLGMCGHATIGLVKTLEHLGKLGLGTHRIDTPVGVVEATLRTDGSVAVRNIRSYRHLADVTLNVEGVGRVRGDVAYGGNWFFLVHEPTEVITPDQIPRLTAISERIREELARQGITGAGGAEVDHVELFGPSEVADSRNFVLCPGGAYDRSPCGTGTSAKLACLVADNKLSEHQVWRQESVTGGLFYGNAVLCEGGIIPTIRGRAFITAESTLILDPSDPYRWGIGA